MDDILLKEMSKDPYQIPMGSEEEGDEEEEEEENNEDY